MQKKVQYKRFFVSLAVLAVFLSLSVSGAMAAQYFVKKKKKTEEKSQAKTEQPTTSDLRNQMALGGACTKEDQKQLNSFNNALKAMEESPGMPLEEIKEIFGDIEDPNITDKIVQLQLRCGQF